MVGDDPAAACYIVQHRLPVMHSATKGPVAVLQAPARVVTLIPSATEIVAALGAGNRLVGRSHECDHPPEAARLPVLTAPKVPLHGRSDEIDRQVKSLLEQALAVYRVEAPLLRDLAPELIVTQAQCDVCAVSLAEVEAATRDWLGGTARILSLAPNGLDDVWADINRVGGALGLAHEAETLVADLTARLRRVADRAAEASHRPSVACIEWIEPLMAAGNWVPELVEIAGGRGLFGVAGRHSPWMYWDDLVDADPEIIVVMPCGFDIDRSRAEIETLTGQPEWNDLQAVKASQVFIVDGNQYFNRPGPRLADSGEILAELFHPDLFPPRHHGSGWVRALPE